MPGIDRSCGWIGCTYDSYNPKKKKCGFWCNFRFFSPEKSRKFLSTLQFCGMRIETPIDFRPRIPIMKSRKTRPKFAISATDSWLCTNSSPRLGPTSTPPRRYPKINGCLGSCQFYRGIKGSLMGKPHEKKNRSDCKMMLRKNPTSVIPMNENYTVYV